MEEVTIYGVSPSYIDKFSVTPREVYPDQMIEVSGYLKSFFIGIENAVVDLYVDGTRVTSTNTQTGGYFKFRINGTDLGVGEHEIQVRYEGSWLLYGRCDSDVVTVKVLKPGELPSTFLPMILIAIAGAAGLSLLVISILKK
jgi:hypothetical protein